MYHLATVIPAIRRVGLPLSRDQLMMLMCAVNEIFLAIDIYLAHSISGTITTYEWIPIVFGSIAGGLLILAGAIALKKRQLASLIALIVLLASIVVGMLGAYFHFVRASLPTGPEGWTVSVNLLVWAPPILAPLTFSLVGLLGISALWEEVPPDSGRLHIFGKIYIRLPFSKTRAYFLMVGMGILATVISSVLDHARTPFDNNWLWVPTITGVFGAAVAVALGVIERPIRADLIVYLATMLLLIIVGLIGAWLHINVDIADTVVVPERFIRGAPFLAPLLFADMGALGIIAMLEPSERASSDE